MTSTIISWGLTISLVGVAVYVYRPDLFNSLASQVQEAKPIAVDSTPKSSKPKSKPKKPVVPKLAGAENIDSGNDSQSAKKKKAPSAADSKPATGPEKPREAPQSEEAGLSDKDFAKQFAQAQSGTKLQVPQKHQPSKKDRRSSKLAATSSPDPSGFSTEASSTTGRDADDDLTPAESPEARPADASISRAGDVSDMLEAPAAKPTTLRLTDVSNENKPKKAANKAFEPVLSKKKRNEQARKEEQRLAREESDRIHEAKKQEQLRTARMAAGTSNQTKANAFTAKANAWQSGTSTAVKTAPKSDTAPLLDTFDPTSSSTAGPAHGSVHTESIDANSANDLKSKAGENAAAAMTASSNREGLSNTSRQGYTGDISEEDQIKILQQQDQEDAWESVTSKKSKRKGKQENDSASGASSPARAPLATVKPQVNGSKANNSTTSKKAETVNRFDSIQDKTADSGFQDAEWEA